jgi:hypothetical protein
MLAEFNFWFQVLGLCFQMLLCWPDLSLPLLSIDIVNILCAYVCIHLFYYLVSPCEAIKRLRYSD